MGVALYRKYRSRRLDDVVGQEHVTELLGRALKSGRVAHAYLFTGPRGVGKTSIARIMAHEINGLDYDEESTHLDIIEIDAASNNGVEDIRDLRDRVQIAPVSAAKKVYIIDEVHMLSKAAFNALLKTLEEPPEHVVFILATTDIDKVPETIISRTQRHSFRRASEADIVKNLQRIAAGETVDVDEDALKLIAQHSDGSFRDSVSLFDQLLSGSEKGTLHKDQVVKSLGLVESDTIEQLITATADGDLASINQLLRSLEHAGVPPRTTAAQLARSLRDRLDESAHYTDLIDELLDVSRSHYPDLKLLSVLGRFNRPSVPQPAAPTAPLVVASAAPKLTAPVPTKPAKQQATKEQVADEQQLKPVKTEPRVLAEPAGPFDWNTLITHVRTHHVALHSVLSKCEPELDGNTLRLYTKSAFYKKKLDDQKYKTLLVGSLQELGYDFEVDIVANAKPLQNSQAAHVAAIMGGGEEVSVDDDA